MIRRRRRPSLSQRSCAWFKGQGLPHRLGQLVGAAGLLDQLHRAELFQPGAETANVGLTPAPAAIASFVIGDRAPAIVRSIAAQDGSSRHEVLKAQGMDRLRGRLYALATPWRMCCW